MYPTSEGWLQGQEYQPDNELGWMHPTSEGWLQGLDAVSSQSPCMDAPLILGVITRGGKDEYHPRKVVDIPPSRGVVTGGQTRLAANR